MADLGQVGLGDFERRIGEAFHIRAVSGDAPAVEMRLSEATALGDAPEGTSRAPFSILFHGPADPTLPQAVYRFEHDELGALELFVVPVEPDAAGPRYQAIFS
jgi:hypothetical protein